MAGAVEDAHGDITVGGQGGEGDVGGGDVGMWGVGMSRTSGCICGNDGVL